MGQIPLGLKHQAIDCRFNRMDMFGQDSYLQADFIHYAGKGYAKNNRRRDLQFLKDFALLYKDIIPQPEIQRLKHVAWQQFLEKVYQKYPLPNALIKAVSGACVSR